MKLEVLLSVMNLELNMLEKMNITSKATVINQCDKAELTQYKNFNIYSYNEKGLSNSRNRGLENVTEDIIVLCDNDMVYANNYEKTILEEFERIKDADIIVFNITNSSREIKQNKKSKRLKWFDLLHYTSCRIAFKNKSIRNSNLRFNTNFGANAKYSNGEDILFLIDALKGGLKIYSSTKNIGTIHETTSTWFKGYDEKFFYDKGALFTAINEKLRKTLILQYLIRHRELYNQISFFNALKIAFNGSKEYLKNVV